MIVKTYDAEKDELTFLYIDGTSDTIDFKEFLNDIESDRARVECLLSMIFESQKIRISKMDEFIRLIEQYVAEIASYESKMVEAAERGDHKLVTSYSKIVATIKDKKNTLKEVRHAIKLQENEEASLKSDLLEIQFSA